MIWHMIDSLGSARRLSNFTIYGRAIQWNFHLSRCERIYPAAALGNSSIRCHSTRVLQSLGFQRNCLPGQWTVLGPTAHALFKSNATGDQAYSRWGLCGEPVCRGIYHRWQGSGAVSHMFRLRAGKTRVLAERCLLQNVL